MRSVVSDYFTRERNSGGPFQLGKDGQVNLGRDGGQVNYDKHSGQVNLDRAGGQVKLNRDAAGGQVDWSSYAEHGLGDHIPYDPDPVYGGDDAFTGTATE